MDTRTGEIKVMEYEAFTDEAYYEDEKTNHMTPLTTQEYKTLSNIDEGKRPAHLAWMRHGNNSLPPKLMFIAGFEAARKMTESE